MLFMMDWSPVIGEFVGTFVLIVLGNGVVAGALLNRSKAQNAGWISITAGWAVAVFAGVAVSAALGDADDDAAAQRLQRARCALGESPAAEQDFAFGLAEPPPLTAGENHSNRLGHVRILALRMRSWSI